MLKGIPKIISPELLKFLCEKGHGDEIIIADGNFPAASHAQRLVRCDGHNVPELLEAILELFPLDTFVESPVSLMQVAKGDELYPVIWNEYKEIISRHGKFKTSEVERFAFYERAKNAYAIVATGESALYANILLKKGVI